jgi:phospholipid-binding lipoprotein MlaA
MKRCILTVLCLIAAAGCATAPKNSAVTATAPIDANSIDNGAFDEFEQELSAQQIIIADPIEPFNRLMFGTNDVLYFWVLKPVAQGYKAVIPEPGRVGIRNFFQNLTTPVRLVNCTLQGKFNSAGREIDRFAINTTWGILGVFDPALEKKNIPMADEDLGQTLAVYGLGNGCYVVLPLFGPSSLRDTGGMVGDMFLNPTFYLEDSKARTGVTVVNVINKTSFRIGEYEAFKAAAVDPYIGMREAYIQYRQKQVEK